MATKNGLYSFAYINTLISNEIEIKGLKSTAMNADISIFNIAKLNLSGSNMKILMWKKPF